MALKIRLTPQAGHDLEEIRAYVVERSPAAADRIRTRIDAVLQRLSDLPLTGAVTSEPNVRVAQLKEYPYRIFYVVREDTIDVLHIRHTSRRNFTPSDT